MDIIYKASLVIENDKARVYAADLFAKGESYESATKKAYNKYVLPSLLMQKLSSKKEAKND